MVKCGNGHVYAVLMLLLLGCFAIHAQCCAMDDMFGEKINLPPSLPCTQGSNTEKCRDCWCCMLVENDICYPSLDLCKASCGKIIN
ncbi:hypothetical protein DAI22_02g097300 [Oryza sativa Japonica Group]|nr:hypothetical protein DAI22_02g097300 [Oryza sativa Japonica Group]